MSEQPSFRKVRNSRFPLSLFGIYLGWLLLMSGIHQGLLVWGHYYAAADALVQTLLPLLYWVGVAALLTLYTQKKIAEQMEKPVQELAAAARKVAEGDFSIYVPALHTEDKYDYLDTLILDFNKMVEELGSIETLKTDFFSNVSHEIKTPLAVIQNTTELLKNENLSPAQRREYVESIDRYTRRLSDLIGNLLKLNKLEKQAIQPRPEPYDLCAQLAECALLFEDRWEAKDIEFEAELEDHLTVEADESLLELVWNNLLSNAVKFTEPGGTILLHQSSGAGEVLVSVTDTGCGMDSATLRHIFDKFYQGDTSHATEGNGLGLALVRRIVQLQGGSITVTSTPGVGSTFTVRLPCRAAPE